MECRADESPQGQGPRLLPSCPSVICLMVSNGCSSSCHHSCQGRREVGIGGKPPSFKGMSQNLYTSLLLTSISQKLITQPCLTAREMRKWMLCPARVKIFDYEGLRLSGPENNKQPLPQQTVNGTCTVGHMPKIFSSDHL